jgi:GNAT superfamily N-acetyltransferase
MINIKKICISELKQFVYSDGYTNMPIVPISRHRAISYIQNPRSLPTDVVLYLAYIDERLVGYRTVFPDTIWVGNNPVKVGWLSGNWVDPNFRRKGIASTLFESAYEDWNQKLLFTNYAEESKAVYDKSCRFINVHTINGIRLYFRPFLTSILCPKGKLYRKMKPIWQVADFILSVFNPLPLISLLLKQQKSISYEYLGTPDDELISYFEKSTQITPTKRTGKDLQWILNHPWLVSSPLGDRIGKKYFFSSSPVRFETLLVKVCRDKELLGFFFANLNGRYFTTPYIFCNDGEERTFAIALLKHAFKMNALRLTTFHQSIAMELKGLWPFCWLSLSQHRKFFATSQLADNLADKMVFLEGDGDCAFV